MPTVIYFETHQYEFAHGRKPRGYGHWLFERENGSFNDGTFLAGPFSGTYSEAKKQAMAWVREHTNATNVTLKVAT